MRQKCYVLAIHTIDRFGGKMQCIQGEAPHTEPIVKYGGRLLMFWRYFAVSDPWALVKINGTINSTKYQELLTENLVVYAMKPWVDDSKHTSKSAQILLSENNIHVLQWISQSPNLNPIKNMWSQWKSFMRANGSAWMNVNHITT